MSDGVGEVQRGLRVRSPQDVRRVLVLRGGAIGDMMLTVPALAAIRRHWPAARIELAARSPAAALAKEGGLVDDVLSLESGEVSRLFVGRIEPDPERAARFAGIEVAVNYLHDPDGRVSRHLAAAGVRGVMAGSPIVTEGHAVDHFLRVLGANGVPVEYGAAPRLEVPAPRVACGREWARALGGAAIVLHPGSGSARKNWPLGHFVSLARRLREKTSFRPVFCTGEADAALAREVAEGPEGFVLMSDVALPELAGRLVAAAAFVGNDGGITHLAAAAGAPVVALFGPTDPDTWGPRGDHVTRVVAAERSVEGLRRIRVDDVWSALMGRIGDRAGG